MAREGYLLHAGEDTLHSGQYELTTPKEKRKHWWNYHKGPIAVILIVGGILFSVFYSIFSKVTPDYTIGVLSSFSMPRSGIEEMERCLTEYADDRNGDGKVVVTVLNYVLPVNITSSNDMQIQESSVVRFSGDFSNNDLVILFHDNAAFEQMIESLSGVFQYNDGTPMPDDAEDFENAMRPWDDLRGLAEFEPDPGEDEAFTAGMLNELYHRLRVSLREDEGTRIEKNAKDKAYYDDCIELYRRLEAGEKRVPEAD